jgi:thioredoxin-like negative regulator of GroEL
MRRVLKVSSIVVLIGVGATCVVLAIAASRESALGEGSLAEARVHLAGSHKLVVIALSQRGCAPCQLMKLTTWHDRRIIQWVRSNSVNGNVVQLDIDQQPEAAKELNAHATPMVVILGEQGEIARREGFMQADEAIAWLVEAASTASRSK